MNGTQFIMVNQAELKSMISEVVSDVLKSVDAKQNQRNNLMDAKTITEEFKISNTTLWRWAKEGLIKPNKIKGRVFYDFNQITETIQNANKKAL